MSPLSLDDLLRALTTAAGQGDQLDLARLDPAVATRTFDDLGYDSLALLETAALLEHEYGIELPEDEITELATPQALLDLVNGSRASQP